MSVGLPDTIVSPAKTAQPIENLLGCGLGLAQGTIYDTGVQIPYAKEQF